MPALSDSSGCPSEGENRGTGCGPEIVCSSLIFAVPGVMDLGKRPDIELDESGLTADGMPLVDVVPLGPKTEGKRSLLGDVGGDISYV
jgi:hypothetical protein